MKIAFHVSDKEREIELGESFAEGARLFGHKVELRRLGPNQRVGDCDLACMVGVKSRQLWIASINAGAQVMMFDKGYSRHRKPGVRSWEYWRMSLNAHHPTRTTLMGTDHDSARFLRLGIEPAEWRGATYREILIAGSSAKYHNFYALPHPTAWAQRLVNKLRRATEDPITYRPKPSWREAVPVEGAEFGDPGLPMSAALANARLLITHGSNACFDALCLGVPCLILGDAVARPISSTQLADVADPQRWDRDQLLWNLAHHQWTAQEMRDGVCWPTIRGWLDGKQGLPPGA